MCEVSSFFTTLSILVICLFSYNHPNGYEIVCHWGFDLHFPDGSWYSLFFHVLINCISSLKKCLFSSFTHFKFDYLSYYKSFYIFWIQVTYQTYVSFPILWVVFLLPGGSDGKASVYNAGDLSSIPRLGRFPGEGNGNPFQYSCLENPMDGGAWCRPLSMGSQRIGYNWATSLYLWRSI